MKKIFTGAVCLFAMSLQAQSWIWAVRSGGVNSEMHAESIVSDASGNTYVAGFFVGTVTIGDNLPVTSTTPFEADGYIAKYNNSGNVSWFRVISGAGIQVATGIALDPSNNICVTGYHSVGATFSGAVSLVTLPGYQNGFVAKYDNAGTALWAKTIGDGAPVAPQTSSTVFTTGIGTDAMGSMYITGSYCSGIQFGAFSKQALGGSGDYDVFVAKCDNAGTINWLTSAGGTNIDESKGIAVTPNGLFFITGRFLSSTMTLDAQVLTKTAAWQNDMFVASYSNAGVANWAVKSSGISALGSDMACGNGIATDGRTCYVTGYYTGDMNLGSVLLTAPSTGAENIFTAKYSNTGAMVWALQEGSVAGTDVGNCIAYDPADGRIYTGGYFRGTTSFNGGLVSVTAIGSADAYYAKYNASTGAYLQLVHGATAANDLVPLSICKGIAGRHTFYSCGYFGGFTSLFYNTLSGVTGKFVAGYTPGVDAAFVNQYAYPTANRMMEAAGADGFSVYPVPAADHVNVDFTGALHETVLITLNDLSGREVLREETAVEMGRVQTSLDVSQLPSGVYFITLTDGEQREIKKIVVGKE